MGLGTNNFGGRIDEAASQAVVDAAIDAGINFLDTADIYGGTRSEEFLGRSLAGRRDRVVLATKFGMRVDSTRPGGASPAYVRRALDGSLKRLRTDHVDLYQLHTPDKEIPIAETLDALNELVRSGKVREMGCSNFSANQLREAIAETKPGAARFVSVQNELNLLERDDLVEGLAETARLHLAYIPYFPLASGLLTGKYGRKEPLPTGTRIASWPTDRAARVLTKATFDRIEALTRFAEKRGHTLLDLAFAWLLAKRPVSSVIAGATSPDQVRANVAAGAWRLEDTDLEELATI